MELKKKQSEDGPMLDLQAAARTTVPVASKEHGEENPRNLIELGHIAFVTVAILTSWLGLWNVSQRHYIKNKDKS